MLSELLEKPAPFSWKQGVSVLWLVVCMAPETSRRMSQGPWEGWELWCSGVSCDPSSFLRLRILAASQLGDPDGVPVFGLGPGPVLVVAGVWGVDQLTEKLY